MSLPLHLSLESILSVPSIYTYAALFVLVMVEGPLVTMVAGWLAFLGYINPLFAYLIIIGADVVSDSIYYGIGYWGRGKFDTSSPKLKKIEYLLKQHSGKTLIIGKLTHFAGVPFLIAAGMAKIRFATFIFYDSVATFPKSLVFLLLGYYFGRSTGVINQYLEYGTFVASALVVLIFISYVLIGKYFDEKLMGNAHHNRE